MKNKILIIVAFLVATVAIAQSNDSRKADEKEMRDLLEHTATGWNKGDLPQYLSAYTPDATEMRTTGPAGGVSAIEETMRKGFWKTGKPLQQLRFENIEIRFLDTKAALLTGKFILSGGEKPERTGWFTTVWIKTDKGWRMVHDHS